MALHTPFTIQMKTGSVKETQLLGIKLGQNIHGPLLISLFGDLGAGKTAFVQGLAKGLDVPDDYYITSPTYTLLNEYPGRYPLYHFDFYRLESEDDIADTGFYERLDTKGIIAVEWAERLSDDLDMDHIRMEFFIEEDDSRNINITAIGPELTQLVKMI